MAQWSDKLDAFLEFNEHDLLTHAGKIQMAVAQRLANERYDEFDTNRRQAQALEADKADIQEIELLLNEVTRK